MDKIPSKSSWRTPFFSLFEVFFQLLLNILGVIFNQIKLLRVHSRSKFCVESYFWIHFPEKFVVFDLNAIFWIKVPYFRVPYKL